MRKHCLALASVPFLVGLMCATGSAQDADAVFLQGANRPGPFYQTLTKDHARRCQDACLTDKQCRAWAYSTVASTDNCSLIDQNPPPPPRQDTCCFTGIKRD
jgi:PAN domain